MQIKRTYFFIILMLSCTSGMAQFSMSYNMSPIASSNKAITYVGGDAVSFDGKGKCLSVVNGLRALEVNYNSKGVFAASCQETRPVATVLIELTSLNVFPNPTHSTSILKCEGQFDANLFCQVRVISMEGRMMMSQMVSMKDVQTGYMINAAAYAAGTYVVSVDFMNQHYTRKLIKI